MLEITMFPVFAISVIIGTIINNSECNDIFHENSKITFYPNVVSNYFGYSVLLTDTGLIVGAPKATNANVKEPIVPGNVFTCNLKNLEDVHNITCSPLQINDGHERFRFRSSNEFYKDDMWLGATVSEVTKGKLLICAPRWSTMYQTRFSLANGACFLRGPNRGMSLYPLQEKKLQAWISDGRRKEYGDYGTHLNFYAYGQAGMSIKVTDMNVIIGAPGLLQWTGGIIDYKIVKMESNSIYFSGEKITNLYKTRELGPDDYFGYSVESGVFEANGGTLYVAGAPRSKSGYGQVLIFDPPIKQEDALKIRAKVHGPHLGSYFGASLCCTDIDGDGRSDLLVGAPTFVRRNDGLPFDQGAVFIYMSRHNGSTFILQEAGFVTGSGESGARFGISIADLGDINDDGYKDIAVGAPWENNGFGAVYIYLGTENGLRSQYLQKIIADGARSFGMSISKGFDVDHNNCNDLAIGAHNSGTAYIYRCVPTMQVSASIIVPDAMDLPQNATNFTALFCVDAPPKKSWPHVQINLKALITVDRDGNRAEILGENEYTIRINPGKKSCDEQTVEVRPRADLSKPITITLDLKPMELMNVNSTTFLMDAARLSEDSQLHSSFDIQLTTDCGEDLTCTPWLVITLEALDNPYVPGTNTSLGAKVTVLNKDEPAYGAKVNLTLPSQPKRVPSACTLQGLNMTCNVPQPLHRGETVEWEIEMEYSMNATKDIDVNISATLEDHLYRQSVADKPNDLVITIHPVATFGVSGESKPNETLAITRDSLNNGDIVKFIHYFEVTNYGPSDWSQLKAQIQFTEFDNVTLATPIPGCTKDIYGYNCDWSIPAKVSKPIKLQLRYDFSEHGKYLLEKEVVNVSTSLRLIEHYKVAHISTTLVLDPAPPIWPLVVGVFSGLLVLSAIIIGLYKFGFFSRKSHEELKRLQEQSSMEGPSVSLDPLIENDAPSEEIASTSSN